MMHGDAAPTSLEVVEVVHSCTIRPEHQVAARPCRGGTARRIGYARITGSQTDLHKAVTALLDAGVQAADIYTDYGPQARSRRRDGLQEALRRAESGDILVVASLVTFARSRGELARLFDALSQQQVTLQIRHQRFTEIPPAKVGGITAAITWQLHTDITAERAAARAALTGRGSITWKLTPRQVVEVIDAYDSGRPPRQIATSHGISLATVYRTVE